MAASSGVNQILYSPLWCQALHTKLVMTALMAFVLIGNRSERLFLAIVAAVLVPVDGKKWIGSGLKS